MGTKIFKTENVMEIANMIRPIDSASADVIAGFANVVNCSIFDPTDIKHYQIYMDPNRAIVYFDCSFHTTLSNPSQENHSLFAHCNNYINNLFKCAFIGLKDIINIKEIYEEMNTFQFKHSTLINNKIQCKNCKIILCIRLSHEICKLFGPSLHRTIDCYFKNLKIFVHQSTFTKIMLVYMFSKLLNYCLSSFHTAIYLLKYTEFRTRLALLSFITIGSVILYSFNSLFISVTDNDRSHAIIFRMACDAFNEFVKTFLKYYGIVTSEIWTMDWKRVNSEMLELKKWIDISYYNVMRHHAKVAYNHAYNKTMRELLPDLKIITALEYNKYDCDADTLKEFHLTQEIMDGFIPRDFVADRDELVRLCSIRSGIFVPMLQESGLLSPNDIEIMDVVDQIKNNKQKSLTQMSIKSGTSTNNSEMFKKKGKINQA
eukprot:59140_1